MSPLSLRERNKQTTQQEIVIAALDLFEVASFDEVTIEQIAERVGISPRTVYRYFPTKASMLFTSQEAWMDAFRIAANETTPDEQWLASLRRISSAVAKHAMADQILVRRAFQIVQSANELAIFRSQWEHDWRVAVATIIADSLSDAQAYVVAAIIMGMISANVELWLAGIITDLDAEISNGFILLTSGLQQLTDASQQSTS
jgi:TetR/AcrR family transcriptional regulator, regulator of mycofactocin system